MGTDLEYLKKRRNDLLYRQKDIAAEMNVSQKTISQIELGTHSEQAEMMGEYFKALSRLEKKPLSKRLSRDRKFPMGTRLSLNLDELKKQEGMTSETIKACLKASEYSVSTAILESRIKVLIDAWVDKSSKTTMDFAKKFNVSETTVTSHLRMINKHVESLLTQFGNGIKPIQQESQPPGEPNLNAYVEKHHKKAIEWAIAFIEGSVLGSIQNKPDSMTDEKIEPYIRDCEKALYNLIDFNNKLDL